MKKVEKIIKKYFDNPKYKKIGKGCINVAYFVKDNDKDYVTRYFPLEDWKAKKEQYLYDLIKRKTDIPVPDVSEVGKHHLILTRIEGEKLSLRNKKLVEKAGEYLAKLHSIKFKKFGWIVGNKIKPSFSNWVNFLEYDLTHKIEKADRRLISQELMDKIKDYFDKNKNLLKIKAKPSLLHKDYHASHILVDKGKIKGIIDVEWAIAGHNEMDLAKTSLWMFSNNRKLENIFLKGYKKYHPISKDYKKRKKLYKLMIMFSSLVFSCDLKSRKWYSFNMKKIKGILNG